MKLFLSILILIFTNIVSVGTPQILSSSTGLNNEFIIVIDSTYHLNYGFKYPITYEFSIPENSSNLSAYHKHRINDNWETLEVKTTSDFYNAVETVRFDYEKNTAYISVAFSSLSDSILILIAAEGMKTTYYNFNKINKYYDNRNAVVTATADDLNGMSLGFSKAINEFRIRKLWLTCGAVTSRLDSNDWYDIQLEIDKGFIEICSHSRTHIPTPYDDYESEVVGSRDDIIENLILTPLFTSGAREYVYSYIYPFGNYTNTLDRTAGAAKYLICRKVNFGQNDFTDWNNNYEMFDRVGVVHEVGPNYSGVSGISDSIILNSKYDEIIENGGIYHISLHPNGIEACSEWESKYMQNHLDYISGHKDIWYVSFGHLYLYNFLSTQLLLPESANKTPVITKQPIDQNIVSGETAIFEVEAKCDGQMGYKWWRVPFQSIEKSMIVDSTDKVQGATSNRLQIFNVNKSDDNTKYMCEIRNLEDFPNVGCFINSDVSTLFVNFESEGDLFLSTQDEIYLFSDSVVKGSLFIGSELETSNVFDITPLSKLEYINGSLCISNTSLSDLNGLQNIKSIKGELIISGNDSLKSLHALDNIKIDSHISINNNRLLNSLNGLNHLTSINGDFFIIENLGLKNMDALYNLNEIDGMLNISENNSLLNLEGLENLLMIGKNLEIKDNKILKDLDGLSNLKFVGRDIVIFYNDSLKNYCGLYPLLSEGDFLGDYMVNSNYYNPTISDIVDYERCDTITTDITSNTLPDEFSLSQNYPNPFNPSTTITFSLPQRVFTKVDVYNSLGEKIHSLIGKELNAGFHELEFSNTSLSSGIYFYRLEAGDFVETKKMILLK